jgi:hypothetical protein
MVKTAFCVLSRNKKKHLPILFGVEFISFPNRGLLSAAPCIIYSSNGSLVDQGFLLTEASPLQSVGTLWTGERPNAETST